MPAPHPKQNRLLATLKQKDFVRIEHELEPVEFPSGKMIHRAGDLIDYLYFPTSLATSISISGENGESAGLTLVGNDGVLGFTVAHGSERSPYDSVSINHGYAFRLRRELAEWEFDQHSSLLWVILRFSQIATFGFAQMAICNQYHTVEQRLCNWLLTVADKTGEINLFMTHAFMAGQLGVRREAISEAAAKLQGMKAIKYSRGKVAILSSEVLTRRSCACGESIKRHQLQLPPQPADTLWRYRVRPNPVSMLRLAEERARHAELPRPASLSDYGRLVAELQVRKNIYEIQLEELIESYAEADHLREKYADLYDFSPVAYASVDASGVLKQINLSCAILLGIKRSESPRHRFVECVVAEQKELFLEFLNQVLKEYGHHRVGISLAATEQRPVAFAILDGIADEAKSECRMVITDVTKEKTYEHSLQRAYDLLDMSHSAANAGSWDWDMVSDQVIWSDNMFHLLGLDPTRAKASFETWRTVLHSDDAVDAEEEIKQAIQDHRKLLAQYRISLPDGKIRWIRSVGEAVYDAAGNPLRMLGICIDATRQMEADAEIQRYAEQYRTVADFTYDWEYWQSPEGKIIYISPSCERISGYRRDEFLSDPSLLTTIVSPEDSARFETHLKTTSELAPGCEIDFRITRKDGATRWISHCCQPVHSEKGVYLGRRVSNRDVTASKSAETKLRLWSESFIHSGLGLVISDAKRNVLLAVNPAFARARGYTAEELIGQPAAIVMAKGGWTEVMEHFNRAQSSHLVMESRSICKDGRIFPVLLDMTLLFDSEGRPESMVIYALETSRIGT